MLLNWARRLYAWSWALAVCILVVLALYASLGRYYIEYLDDFQPQIVAELEQRTGLDFEIGKLQGSWSGLSPVIDFERVAIRDEAGLALSFQSASIELGVISGLLFQRMDINQLLVDGLRIHMRQADSVWSFAGVKLGGGGAGADWLLDALMALRDVQLSNTRTVLHYQEQAPATFWSEQLGLEGDGFFRRLSATFGVDKSEPAHLIVEARGDPRDRSFRADAFVRLEDTQFETLGPLFGELSELADGTASGDLWLQWKSGGETRLQGSMQVPQLAVGAFWKRPSQQVTDIKVEFGGRFEDGLWQFWFPEFQGHWHGQDVRFENFRLDQLGDEAQLLRLSMQSLDTGFVRKAFTGTGLLPGELEKVLGKLAPRGHLNKLQLTLPLRLGEGISPVFEAELADIAVEPWHGAPGLSGLNGHLNLEGASGRVLVDSEQLAMTFPGLYPGPLEVREFRAALDWQLRDDAVQVLSGPISFRDEQARFGALLALDLPLSKDSGDPTMTLSIGIRDGSAKLHKKLIPENLSPGLKQWLADSIKGGDINSGAFVYRGSLLPDDSADRTVQMFFDVADASLNYHADWPALQDIKGLVSIDDGDTTANVESARLYDNSRLGGATVAVLPRGDDLRLTVTGKAKLPLDEVLQLLTRSPVRDQVGSVMDRWRAEGWATADLKLDIPLQGEGGPDVRIDANVNNGSLFLDDYRLTATKLNGPLHFDTDNGLKSPQLQGEFYGKPITARISQGAGQPLLVDIEGRIAAADLRDWIQQPILDFADGETGFHVRIQAGGEASRLNALSDLRGLGFTLPEPLFKDAGESRELTLTLPLVGEQPQLRMNIADMGSFLLQFGESGGFGGAALTLGPGEPVVVEPGLFRIGGALPAANFDDWQNALQRYLSYSEKYVDPDGPDSEGVPIRVDALQIADLLIAERHFEELLLSAGNGELGLDPWQLQVSNPMLTGVLWIPEDYEQGVLRAHLSSLYLPAFTELEVSDAEALPELQHSVVEDVDPRELLDIDVDIDHLFFGSEDWGSLGFNLRSDSRGATFSAMRGRLRGVAIDGRGEPAEFRWTRNDEGDHSHFQGSLFVDEIGDVLQAWQFPRMMESESGRFMVDLQWPSAPDLITSTQVQGKVDMNFSKGRLLEAPEIASGTLRMVAIFNFANILRRLQLDFRDVFKRGIHYDEVDGSLNFSEGIMAMNRPLVVKGPSSQFQLTGNLDFNTDLTDMELVATLPIRSNLPWIAALVSGLPVAAGVFIASKLFEEQVDKFSSAVYGVTGSWRDPKLKFRRIFDANGGGGRGSENTLKPGKPGKLRVGNGDHESEPAAEGSAEGDNAPGDEGASP